MNTTKLVFAVLFSSFFALNAQHKQRNAHNHSHMDEFRLPMEFSKDSLVGFDEPAAWREAKANASEEWQQARIVAVLKRSYIDVKYGYAKIAPPQILQGPCSNPGFETGTTAGWTTSESPNNNSQTMLPWSNLATTQAIVVGQGTDPNVSVLPTVPAGGGNFALRLGPTGHTTGGNSYRASQSFSVTAANSVFIYRYAVVLNNTSPHSCSEQPFFNIRFEDCNNNPIPCGNFNVFASSSACSSGSTSFATTTNSSGNSWSYLTWQTRAFDLTNYIGQCVNVEFTVGGCVTSQGAHGGYAYIDASCSPMTLNLNGTDIPVGQTNNAFCGGSTTNTLCAPPGFSYNWSGPGITGQTGQCVNTSSNGTFSVTLGVLGSTCAFNPVLYSAFNSAPNPTVTADVEQPICALPAGSATINPVGGLGNYTYSWTPSAPSASVNTNLPTNSIYTVTATDENGCKGSVTFTIDPFPPAPDYTLTVVPDYVISCASPSTTITFLANPANTQNTWFNPLGSAITNTSVVVTTPGVYTYTTINTVSTCSLTGSINITGSANIPVLTSTLSQPDCFTSTGSATVSASNGTAPYTYDWTPSVPNPTATVNSNLPPGSSYIVTAIDDAGCIASTTLSINPFPGAPSYTLFSNPGLALSCSSPTTALNFAPTNTNTSVSWNGPTGAISGTTSIISTNAAGTYTYIATNTVSTCSVSGTFVVTADTIKPTATYTLGCSTNTIGFGASAANPDIGLYWFIPSTPTSTIVSTGSSTVQGTYTLAVVEPSNGCVRTYTALANVPQLSIATTPTTNIITCLTPTINASATSTPTGTIVWTSSSSTVTADDLAITSGGTYTITSTNDIGCTTVDVITITTNTTANVSISGPNLIPCATGSINLTANSTGGGTYTYNWSPSNPAVTGSVFTATNANTYVVVATNAANGCTATASQPVSYETVDASFDANVYEGLTPLPVTFTNTSIGSNPAGTSYSWSFGDGNNLASNDPTVSHTYNTGGNFPVILTATNGFCQDTAVRYIKVEIFSKFIVPNVFTPNGDGKNDVFTFDALNMDDIILTIYDRWGLKMFEKTSKGNVVWDGKNMSGNMVTDGTYFYIIKATGLDGSKYDLSGSVNVFQ